MIQHSPACERNRDPILQVLQRVLSKSTAVLEISSGTGMHAVHMANSLPQLSWQPTDISDSALLSIEAWRQLHPSPGLRSPVRLDVRTEDWEVGPIDAIFCANMIHIAPWAAAEGLLAGAGRLLPSEGRLVIYGPFQIAGGHTATSNARFDASLRSRDPSWGIRELESVCSEANRHQLALIESVQMPANNLILVLERA
jgi:hypothetical protein